MRIVTLVSSQFFRTKNKKEKKKTNQDKTKQNKKDMHASNKSRD